MSYISLKKDAPSFTKAVISFWFKVPQVTLDAVNASSGEGLFPGIVPLVVMGQEGSKDQPIIRDANTHALEYNHTGYQVHYGPNTSNTVCLDPRFSPDWCAKSRTTFEYCPGAYFETLTSPSYTTVYNTHTTGPAPPSDPTMIGVSIAGGGTLFLTVNFETNELPEVTGYYERRGVSSPGTSTGPGPFAYEGGVPYPPPDGAACPTGVKVTETTYTGPLDFLGTRTTISDSTGFLMYPVLTTTIVKPTYQFVDIGNVGNRSAAITSDVIGGFKADQWHHILVSVELKTIKARTANDELENVSGRPTNEFVESASKLWIALDDKNYTQWDLSNAWNWGGDDNEVLTQDAVRIAGDPYPQRDDGAPTDGGKYTLSSPSVPAGTIGLPAPSKYVDKVLNVEMAEFQMWTDVTLDTGVTSNRRAFIDYKSGGNGGNGGLKPVDPKRAAELLGKKPGIKLHGSGNWKSGRNTGTLGVDSEGKKKDEGQFDPTGKIVKYKPEPELGK